MSILEGSSILVTGGTGPAPRDQTPEAVADVAEKELPGFGEEMRRASLAEVPTAILSRQTAVIQDWLAGRLGGALAGLAVPATSFHTFAHAALSGAGGNDEP